MMSSGDKQLHWTQRIALVRHNLHSASRSGDFTFFKTLQAAGLMEGTNHVATLSAELGDETDTIVAAMDNLNAGLAYVHQDAFKAVYDSIKEDLGSEDARKINDVRSKVFVDCSMQRNNADAALDKMTSSAISLINQLPAQAQDAAVNVWITGLTIIADTIQVSLKQLDALDSKVDDFICLEESWNIVKASVVSAVTGLKGVFQLMDPSLPWSTKSSPRSSSIASASAVVFRRLSHAFVPSAASSRNPSVVSISSAPSLSSSLPNKQTFSANSTHGAPVYCTPNYVRSSQRTNNSVGPPTTSHGGPNDLWFQHKLTTIPPTPAYDDSKDPFDTSNLGDVPPVPVITDQALDRGRGVGMFATPSRNNMTMV